MRLFELGRCLLGVGAGTILLACGDAGDEQASDPAADSAGTDQGSGQTTSVTGTTSTSDDPASSSSSGGAATTASSTSDLGGFEDGWFEVGWGIDAFNPIEDELPLFIGPQGLHMFSLPLRGGNFAMAEEPYGFDDPLLPILTIWVDVDGFEGAGGHLSEYADYAVPFKVDLTGEADYEFVAVWLVVPDTIDPEALVGLPAHLHAELDTADGQHLSLDHDLEVTLGETP